MKFDPPDCEFCKSRKDSLFQYCPMHELQEINSLKSCTQYKRGQIIFQEGSKPIGLYCINSGKIKIYKYASDGKEQIIRISKEGDVIGFCSLLSETRYPVSAAAIEDCVICLVPKEEIDHLFKDNSRFSEGYIQLLCNTIGQGYMKMADLAYKPVRGRIAEGLLLLHNSFKSEQNPDGIISLTREDLASLVGTVKETTIRVLKEFKNENLIETRKTDIHVLDPRGLTRIAELYD